MHILPTIEEWSASKDSFRVVAYGFSRPFPLEPQIIENEPLIDYHEANIAPRLSEILARNGISFSSIGMLRMVERDKPRTNFVYELEFVDHDELSTLLITTTSEDTSNWKIAAEEIFSIYADGGFSKDQIEVEIRNPERMAWYTSDILDDDIDILATCQSVKSVVLDQFVLIVVWLGHQLPFISELKFAAITTDQGSQPSSFTATRDLVVILTRLNQLY